MRSCKKNQRPIIVLNYLGKRETKDENGYKTGEKSIYYGEEIVFMGHISGAKGSSMVELFGTDISYDKVITISRAVCKKLKIDENSVFFIDKKPQYSGDMPLYDYKVKRIADTLNEVAIAITQVRNN